jgi:epoxide hydrolase-like predicted phosphatase
MADRDHKIKAAVFDWGGVIIDEPAEGLFRYCADALGVKPEEFRTMFSDYHTGFQKGMLPEDEIWTGICARLGVAEPEQESLWGEAVRAVFTEKKETFKLIRKLKRKGLRMGFLSNTEKPSMSYFEERDYGRRCGFNAIVASCDVGSVKPEEKIYRVALDRLVVLPHEAVFIDDNPEFVRGAERVGINGILYENHAQLKKDLCAMLKR